MPEEYLKKLKNVDSIKERVRWAINYVSDVYGMTNEKLGEYIGCSTSTINSYRRKGDPKNMSLIKVAGDSMEPTFFAGDLVLVNHERNRIDPQGGIYAISINGEIMIKRIQVLYPHKKVKIISDNSNYESIGAEPDQLKINGKVIWFAREIER